VDVHGFSPSGHLVELAQGPHISLWDLATGTPLTPPLEHLPNPYLLAFPPDGSHLVPCANDATTCRWALPSDTRPADQLRRLAQLLAGQRIDASGSLVPLSREQLRAAWTGK